MAIRKVIPRSLDSAAASANLSFDANTLFVDSTHNVVGINTATPNSFATGLAVYNATNPSVAIVSGNANAYLRLSSTSDTDMYLSNVGGAMNFVTAGTAKMYLSSAGNVGIGTSSFLNSEKLQVKGAALGTTAGNTAYNTVFYTPDTSNTTRLSVLDFRVSNGSSHTSSINKIQRRVDVTDMGFVGFGSSGSGNNVVSFGNGTTEYAGFDSSGNLGIGTSSPTTSLDLFSNTAGGSISSITFSANNSSSAKKDYVQLVPSIEFNTAGSEAGGYTLKVLQQGAYKNSIVASGITNNSTNILAFSTTNEAMRIDSSGNVGIGTTSPSKKLEVFATANSLQILSVVRNVNTGTGVAAIGFNTSGGGEATSTKAGIGLVRGFAFGGGRLAFYNNNSSAAGDFTTADEKMCIDSSGNVGIGTSSPAYKLEVRSTMAVLDGSANIGFWANGTSYTQVWQTLQSVNDFIIQTAASKYMSFGTNSTERMRIDTSGTVLVNTTATLGGDGAAMAVKALGSSSLAFQLGNASIVGDLARFYYGATKVGSISITSGATAYNTSSDYRLKNSIAPMTGALAKVALLKPCTYKWNADGSDGQGFIAHELAEVVPQCVSGDKDAVKEDGSIDPQGIDTSFLVATLTAAIQEQQALITSLTARITALESN